MDARLTTVDYASHRDHDHDTVTQFAARRAPRRASVPTVQASAWYHDAAIESARRDAIEALANPYAHR